MVEGPNLKYYQSSYELAIQYKYNNKKVFGTVFKMKLLVLLLVVIGLVVAASANVVPEGDVESVYTLDAQPEDPEGLVYAVEDSAPPAVRVFNAPEAEGSPDRELSFFALINIHIN